MVHTETRAYGDFAYGRTDGVGNGETKGELRGDGVELGDTTSPAIR